MSDQNKQKKKVDTFLIIILAFLIIMTISNFIVFKMTRVNYDILSKSISYQINEDGTVSLFSTLEILAKDEKSLRKLLGNFQQPDEEKKKTFEKFTEKLNKDTGLNLKVLDYSSKINHSGMKIKVEENAVFSGMVEKIKDNELKFTLKGQKMNVDSLTTLYIRIPPKWKIISVKTNVDPTESKENYLMWQGVGELEFPEVIILKEE